MGAGAAGARDSASTTGRDGPAASTSDDDAAARRRMWAIVGSLVVLVIAVVVALAVLRPFDGAQLDPKGASETVATTAVPTSQPGARHGPGHDERTSPCPSTRSGRIPASDASRGTRCTSWPAGPRITPPVRTRLSDPNGLTDPSFHKYNVDGLPDANTASLIGSLDGEQPFFVGHRRDPHLRSRRSAVPRHERHRPRDQPRPVRRATVTLSHPPESDRWLRG